MDFLLGKTYLPSDFIIFSFHGDEGKFCLPELGEDIYYEYEPRGNFGPEEISQYCKIRTPLIINTGCTLGNQALAHSFLAKACHTYIGSRDYIEGMSTAFFVVRFFYELYQNGRSAQEAFAAARSTDSETMLFEWFQ